MRKLVLNSTQVSELKEKGAKTVKLVFKEMGTYLNEKIKIGSEFEIESDNNKVKVHSGTYYLLFLEEFNTVFLFYVDSTNKLRTVYSGDIGNAVSSIYKNIGNKSIVKILKSSNKKAYRVAKFRDEKCIEIKTFAYKNKSSQRVEQVYLSLFEAINYASKLYKENNKYSYRVITPKETELFRIG